MILKCIFLVYTEIKLLYLGCYNFLERIVFKLHKSRKGSYKMLVFHHVFI